MLRISLILLSVSQRLFAAETIIPQTFLACEEAFARADANSLVVFDIDDVLISVVDRCLKPEADCIVQPLIQKAYTAVAGIKTACSYSFLRE